MYLFVKHISLHILYACFHIYIAWVCFKQMIATVYEHLDSEPSTKSGDFLAVQSRYSKPKSFETFRKLMVNGQNPVIVAIHNMLLLP